MLPILQIITSLNNSHLTPPSIQLFTKRKRPLASMFRARASVRVACLPRLINLQAVEGVEREKGSVDGSGCWINMQRNEDEIRVGSLVPENRYRRARCKTVFNLFRLPRSQTLSFRYSPSSPLTTTPICIAFVSGAIAFRLEEPRLPDPFSLANYYSLSLSNYTR